jgi:hypothetical protein
MTFVGLVDWTNIRRLGGEKTWQTLDDTRPLQLGKPLIQPQQDAPSSHRADDHRRRLPTILLSDLKGNGFNPFEKIRVPQVRRIEISGRCDVAFECLCRTLSRAFDQAELRPIEFDLRQFPRRG